MGKIRHWRPTAILQSLLRQTAKIKRSQTRIQRHKHHCQRRSSWTNGLGISETHGVGNVQRNYEQNENGFTRFALVYERYEFLEVANAQVDAQKNPWKYSDFEIRKPPGEKWWRPDGQEHRFP